MAQFVIEDLFRFDKWGRTASTASQWLALVIPGIVQVGRSWLQNSVLVDVDGFQKPAWRAHVLETRDSASHIVLVNDDVASSVGSLPHEVIAHIALIFVQDGGIVPIGVHHLESVQHVDLRPYAQCSRLIREVVVRW